MTREEWLIKAVEELAPLVEAEHGPFTHPSVSVGFGPQKPHSAIGWCCPNTITDDGKPTIFISPVLKAARAAAAQDGILATLLHELCHAALPPGTGHRKPFAKLAEAVGLEGPPTATWASEALVPKLEEIAEKLGPFPHAALRFDGEEKKQSTRMLKAFCPESGYTVRLTKKWIDEIGLPICPCCDAEMEQEKEEE